MLDGGGTQVELCTGAPGVELDLTGDAGQLELCTGAPGEELDSVTGQTVVETATQEVTTCVSVWLSGWAGQLVTVLAQLVIVTSVVE